MRRPFLVSRRAKAGAISVALLGVLTAGLLPASPVSAQGNACENRNNNTYAKLLECVTLEGVREHQAAFQAIADANDDPSYPGSRAAGTEGYAGSVDYVVGLLEDAGYNVTLDQFEFTFVFPAELQQVTPTPTDYETGTFTGSGSADVTTAITAVDINVVAPMANSSGCDGAFTEGGVVGNPIVADPAGPDDFAGFTAGNIALLQRGSCSFALKAMNAEAAGASAVIIFNQGNDPTRVDLIVGNAAPPVGSTAPA